MNIIDNTQDGTQEEISTLKLCPEEGSDTNVDCYLMSGPDWDSSLPY